MPPENANVAIVRTPPKTVLEDYARLLDLIDYKNTLDNGTLYLELNDNHPFFIRYLSRMNKVGLINNSIMRKIFLNLKTYLLLNIMFMMIQSN